MANSITGAIVFLSCPPLLCVAVRIQTFLEFVRRRVCSQRHGTLPTCDRKYTVVLSAPFIAKKRKKAAVRWWNGRQTTAGQAWETAAWRRRDHLFLPADVRLLFSVRKGWRFSEEDALFAPDDGVQNPAGRGWWRQAHRYGDILILDNGVCSPLKCGVAALEVSAIISLADGGARKRRVTYMTGASLRCVSVHINGEKTRKRGVERQ